VTAAVIRYCCSYSSVRLRCARQQQQAYEQTVTVTNALSKQIQTTLLMLILVSLVCQGQLVFFTLTFVVCWCCVRACAGALLCTYAVYFIQQAPHATLISCIAQRTAHSVIPPLWDCIEVTESGQQWTSVVAVRRDTPTTRAAITHMQRVSCTV
jgi:hypothetical protein